MELLFINYFLAIYLFVFSYYVDTKSGTRNKTLTSVCLSTACAIFFLGLAAHCAYVSNSRVFLLLLRIGLLLLSVSILLLLRTSFFYPYFKPSKFRNAIVALLTLVSAYCLFAYIDNFYYEPQHGFIITRTADSFLGISLFDWYLKIYFLGIPILAGVIFFIRSALLRSKIYKFQVRLMGLSTIAGLFVFVLLSILASSQSVFFWITPVAFCGFILIAVLLFECADITILVDKKIILLRMLNVFLTTVLIGVVFGIIATVSSASAYMLEHSGLMSFIVAIVMMGLLAFRVWADRRVAKLLHADSDYGPDLEKALSEVDYTVGGQGVIDSTVEIFKRFFECDSLDYVIEGDDGMLSVRYSTEGRVESIDPHTKGLESLLNQNVMVLLKTQLVTQHNFAEHKGELLALFDKFNSDAMVIMQEGRRLIGIIFLGTKRLGNDYTAYDFEVMTNLYSQFFVIMYYLKNIAHESVIRTVDRELEFSGQIIQSIQENVDKIHHEKVDVDYISQSARKLGGDFIDFIKLSSERYIFVMGDVSGKGLNASMSMVILKSVIRTFLQETTDFKELVIKVNGFVKSNLPKGTFFSGLFGLFDFSSNTLYYINCGIPTMLLYTTAYNNAVEIQGEGYVLGFVSDIEHYAKVKKIKLNPYDTLLLTTDGLIDSVSLRGDRYGKDRVQRFLIDNRHYPAPRITQFLVDSLMEFTSRELSDDVTVLAVKYLSK